MQADVRDMGSILGSGSSPEGEGGNPFQYSCLENSRDGGAWWTTVHGVAKSQTSLKQLSTHTAGRMKKIDTAGWAVGNSPYTMSNIW